MAEGKLNSFNNDIEEENNKENKNILENLVEDTEKIVETLNKIIENKNKIDYKKEAFYILKYSLLSFVLKTQIECLAEVFKENIKTFEDD